MEQRGSQLIFDEFEQAAGLAETIPKDQALEALERVGAAIRGWSDEASGLNFALNGQRGRYNELQGNIARLRPAFVRLTSIVVGQETQGFDPDAAFRDLLGPSPEAGN